MLIYALFFIVSLLVALVLISLIKSMYPHRFTGVAREHTRGARHRQMRSPPDFSDVWRAWFNGLRGGREGALSRRGNQPLRKPWGW